MADFITSTSTSTSSQHSSPSRKRTREPQTTRSSSYSSSCKAAATVSSNVEVMESIEPEVPITLPSITQPRSSIHSIQNGLCSVPKIITPVDDANLTPTTISNGTIITVSISSLYLYNIFITF